MKLLIKRYREQAGFTQAQVADKVGVSQSTYQRWESGTLSPSAETIEILAKLFGTSVKAIAGFVEPFDVIGLNAGDSSRSYFGEIAVHFRSGGQPLLLSISWDTYERASLSIQSENAFLVVESLDNRLVFVRRDAIADVYFSHDACDEFGPSDEEYEQPVGIFPDDEFWAQVERLCGSDDIASETDDEELRRMLEPTADDFNRPGISEAQRAQLLSLAEEDSEHLFSLATQMKWQMGSLQRSKSLDPDADVYGFLAFLEDTPSDEVLSTISLMTDGGYRVIHINPDALDYIAVPKHKYNAIENSELAEMASQ